MMGQRKELLQQTYCGIVRMVVIQRYWGGGYLVGVILGLAAC